MKVLVTGSSGQDIGEALMRRLQRMEHVPRDRVYVDERLRTGGDHRSALAQAIGSKGYHATVFADGPYPVD